MKAAPISLVDYFTTDLSFSTNKAFSAEKDVQFIETEFSVVPSVIKHSGKSSPDRSWQVSLEIQHQVAPATNFPCSYRVSLVGLFTVATRVKEEDEERTVKVHGASVLYGIAREIVRAVTGRGPHRPVLLPTVSFYETKPTEPPVADGKVPVPPPSKKRTKS